MLRELPNSTIHMTLTSPPYDGIRTYNGYVFDFPAVAQELYRVTTEGGVVIWNVADATENGSETGTAFRQALGFMECGFKLHDTMLYIKANPLPSPRSSKRYHQGWEYLFCFSKGTPTTFNPILVPSKYAHLKESNITRRSEQGTQQRAKMPRSTETKVVNYFVYPIGGGITTKDKIAYQHPALMPEALAHDQIGTWTNPGDLVCDPFTGAGTTAKMATLLGRRFLGAEISEEYCRIAQARVEHK